MTGAIRPELTAASCMVFKPDHGRMGHQSMKGVVMSSVTDPMSSAIQMARTMNLRMLLGLPSGLSMCLCLGLSPMITPPPARRFAEYGPNCENSHANAAETASQARSWTPAMPPAAVSD